MTQFTEKDRQRFFALVNKTPTCWFWIGAQRRGPNGYGIFSFQGKSWAAHRISYALAHPEVEELMTTVTRHIAGQGIRTDYILHSCDNPSCVNPDHLRMGAQMDNTDDMVAKNRNKACKYPTAKAGQRRAPDHAYNPRFGTADAVPEDWKMGAEHIEWVARKLTATMRGIVIANDDDGHTVYSLGASMPTIHALEARGLVHQVGRDGVKWPQLTSIKWPLTPLGKAVRNFVAFMHFTNPT